MEKIYQEAVKNTKESLHVLLKGLGETSPQIRDELVYENLCNFIKSEDNNKTINEKIFHELLGQGHMGLEGYLIEQVLMRSFSTLFLSNIIFEDNNRFLKLSINDLNKAFSTIKTYLNNEETIAEKSEKYGWIHCFAHGGDALTTIMIHKNTDETLAKDISSFILGLEKCSKVKKLDSSSKERLNGAISIGKALKKIG